MPTASFNKFNSFAEAVAEGKHNFSTAIVKAAFTNTAPVAATHTQYGSGGGAELDDLATGNGYTKGGATCALTSSSQTGGVYKLVLASPSTWTASGGSIGPFRYVFLYDDSATNDELIGWWDYGSSVTVLETETFDLTLSAVNGVFTLT